MDHKGDDSLRIIEETTEAASTIVALAAQLSEASKREIMLAIADLKKDLTEVVAQTKETNGRVKAIELWRAKMEGVVDGAGGTGRFLSIIIGTSIGAAGVAVGVAGLIFGGN